MPLYEYKCDACGRRFERIQKFSDPPAEACAHCGARDVHKLLSSPAIQFKGSGWYITDYARKGAAGDDGAKADAKSETPAPSETSSKSESSDSKSPPASPPAAAPEAKK